MYKSSYITPEGNARHEIDQNLINAGWIIQDKNQINLSAGLGVAVREYPTESGPTDYILFIDQKPIGVIEAKRPEEGLHLTIHEDQTAKYAESQLKWCINKETLRFRYESTGILTRFTDIKDKIHQSRPIFNFQQPDTLLEWLKQDDTLRNRLTRIPPLDPCNLWDCQITAIRNLERSFAENRPRALIQMATGSGKTFTAITSIYRLLKHAQAKRILFLVDTRNLGEQAEQEFIGYSPVDDPRNFTELYNVQRLNSRYISKDSQVCISTIQRMYSILKGQDLDESAEETSLNEIIQIKPTEEVVYNGKYPPEFFDFIVIDECHRSIYNLWKQVLDYFDAFYIGLTATPDKRTYAFFRENVVSEYSHEQAVIDGVNVGYDVYLIETEITQQGSKIKAKEYIDIRDKLTREERWDQLDEDLDYTANDLDKSVVNPSQIRNIIKTFKDKLLTEIFPNRKEIPKTLIFAKTDSHADDIIQITRQVFAQSNEFCKKITYRSPDNPKSILSSFRNDYYPRIAVTVDMIATGTDVKPIECIIFMRDVKSKNYFEQMKGRGTRTLGKDDLRKVTPSASDNKTHFVIIDAVGVCQSLKTDSRPLERKPSVPLKDLMMNIAMGNRDKDVMLSIANRLTRLDKAASPEEQKGFQEVSVGVSFKDIVKKLLNAHDPDYIQERTREKFNLKPSDEITQEQLEDVQEELSEHASAVFNNPQVRDYIENVRKIHEQIIDIVNIDTVVNAGWQKQTSEQAQKIIQIFRDFIEENKDEITTLKIFYNQPYRMREITYKMIKELYTALQKPPYSLTPERLWNAYYQVDNKKVRGISTKRMLTDIVSLLRYELKIDNELAPFSEIINRNFKTWVFKKNAGNIQFTEEQMDWLRMIKDHITSSMRISRESFDYTPFNESGGLGRYYQVFGQDYENILNEMNEELVK
ncbi:MAG: type I restriction-modification enzyme R subunit C-terminal domain-containing protein [Eubacteriales bacterium]